MGRRPAVLLVCGAKVCGTLVYKVASLWGGGRRRRWSVGHWSTRCWSAGRWPTRCWSVGRRPVVSLVYRALVYRALVYKVLVCGVEAYGVAALRSYIGSSTYRAGHAVGRHAGGAAARVLCGDHGWSSASRRGDWVAAIDQPGRGRCGGLAYSGRRWSVGQAAAGVYVPR